MISWGMGVVLCLLLLTGCGGGHQGLVKNDIVPPDTEVSSQKTAADESLTEELSAKRLEELYAKSGIPGWDPGLEEEMKKWDHQIKFDVPIQVNRQVRAYLVYFSTERKETIRRYLSRSTRYLPMIKEVFQEYGLPEDLAYLAMIESGFNSHAYSPAHACGMWQFIRGTGARYGLAIDRYVDERRDPEKSTRAAAKYLLDLYKQFGSWYLAAASYNCGEGRVQKELNQSNHKNFWELSAHQCLPNETKNYVPQMIAATIIAKNPEKFGFKNVPHLPRLAVEKVQVHEPTSLKAAAMAINVPVDEVQALNPGLLRGVTPPEGNYTLNLPPKSKEIFARNIMMARLDHPAVASRPHREWKAASRHTSSRHRSASSHSKKHRKGKAYARKSGKKGKSEVALAKKGKSGHNHREKAVRVHTASMLPVGSHHKAGHRNKAKTKTRVALRHSKGKAVEKANGKKKGVRLAKRTESPAKSSRHSGRRNASSSRKHKGKISKSSSRPVLVSEAR
jgi:hypothetical protein